MADEEPIEQWEHALVRLQTTSGQIELVPSKHGYQFNGQPGWTSLFDVLDHLGADGWQLIGPENVDANAISGRLWLKRRVKVKRVARPEDNVH